MQNLKLKGFTLAEMMVCLAVISVIATLMMPAINNLRPNKSKVMFKKAFYLTERIVSEMINDEDMYPQTEGLHGFDNLTVATINGTSYGSDEEPIDPATIEQNPGESEEAYAARKLAQIAANAAYDAAAKAKFCGLFSTHLNTIEEDATIREHCNNATYSTFENPTFTTTDGIVWILPITAFDWNMPEMCSSDDPAECDDDCHAECDAMDNPYQPIQVDVNGLEKGPNCMDGAEGCTNPDRFKIMVRTDGRMKAANDSVRAREYLDTTNMIDR